MFPATARRRGCGRPSLASGSTTARRRICRAATGRPSTCISRVPTAYNFHLDQLWPSQRRTVTRMSSARGIRPITVPPALAQLFYNAGARFVLVQGVHHDNFDNWNSHYNPWNMMNFGAKRDTMAEWTNALRSLGMHFGVAFHHEYSWWFTQPDFLSDSSGPFAGVPYDAVTATNSAGTWWQNYDVAPALQPGSAQISGHQHADYGLLESRRRASSRTTWITAIGMPRNGRCGCWTWWKITIRISSTPTAIPRSRSAAT